MEVIKVTPSDQERFINYCSQYAVEHDNSFLPDADFDPQGTHPAYILLEDQEVVGAVCLILTRPFVEANKGRFLIFHSTTADLKAYRMLWDAIQPHTQDIDFSYLFVPEEKTHIRGILDQLGFRIQRYSFVLSRDVEPVPQVNLPEGFSYRSISETDKQGMKDFSQVANISFANLMGHVDLTWEDIRKFFAYSDYLPGGLRLLLNGETAVGTLNVAVDEEVENGTFLGGLSILPEYQGRGLGRTTLREGIRFSKEKGFSKISLSVNAENDNAVKLYLDEGFNKDQTVVCYEKRRSN